MDNVSHNQYMVSDKQVSVKFKHSDLSVTRRNSSQSN